MTTDLTTLVTGPVPSTPTTRGSRAIRFPRSPKIIAGLVILAVFAVLAIIGPLLEPYSPNEINQNWVKITCQYGPYQCIGQIDPVTHLPGTQVPLEEPLPPSSAHPLGTTLLGQDVWSQLLELDASHPGRRLSGRPGGDRARRSGRGQRRLPGRQR